MFKVTRAVFNTLREEAERVGGVGAGTWFRGGKDGCTDGFCIWGLAYRAGLVPVLNNPIGQLFRLQPEVVECPVLPFSYRHSDNAVDRAKRELKALGKETGERVPFDLWAKHIGLEVE